MRFYKDNEPQILFSELSINRQGLQLKPIKKESMIYRRTVKARLNGVIVMLDFRHLTQKLLDCRQIQLL